MQIILKKKNASTSDRTYPIDEGSTITENYNETLDSAVVRISHLDEQLDIEPFDKVVLHDEIKYRPGPGLPSVNRQSDRYMCVDTYTETMESLDPVLYSYEIHLFSRTKELENYILPNLSITKNNTNKTVWDYLKQYVYYMYNHLGIKMRISTGFTNRFSFDEVNYDFAGKFNVVCPEMQWNNPTLREVLTSLMMVCDCIPVVLNNNKIGFIDLTLTDNSKQTAQLSHINYVQNSQSSEDYVSELRMDMVNVMQTSVDGVKQTISKIENQTLRPSEGYVITEENMCMKVEFPILTVKHLYLTFPMNTSISGDNNVFQMLKYDLCNLELKSGTTVNLVYEKQQYDALPAQRYKPSDFSTIGQANTIFYTRGDNRITGFSEFYKVSWMEDTTLLKNLKKLLADNCVNLNGELSIAGNELSLKNTAWFSTFFTIEYETTADAVFQASKDIAPAHERIVADNQTYSFVDAYNQGFMEYQKANRLGNKQLFINARFNNDYGNIIKIGDTFNDENIVFQTQYQIYENHIEVNATATKDYILRDYFTGVKARIRSWQIADAASSFTSHRLKKYYLEFSKKIKSVKYTPEEDTAYYFLSPLYLDTIRPLKYCFVKTYDGSSYYPGSGEYYTLELLGRIIGNSIVFTFGFNDNYNAPEMAGYNMTQADVETSDITPPSVPSRNIFHIGNSYKSSYGGVPLSNTPYTSNYGEMQEIDYYFSYDINFPYYPDDYAESDQSSTDRSKQQAFLYWETLLPYIYSYTYFLNYTKISDTIDDCYKDNKEIFKMSHQFELCSDTHDIVFTKKFLEYQECIRESGIIVKSTSNYVASEFNFTYNSLLQKWIGSVTYTLTGTLKTINYYVLVGSEYVILQWSQTGNVITLTAGSDIDPYQYPVRVRLVIEQEVNTMELEVYQAKKSDYSYNFRDTSVKGTKIGDTSNVVCHRVNNAIAYVALENLTLLPDTTVEDSIFYITVKGEDTLLMLNGLTIVYLNTLLSRDYNIYDSDGNVVDEI